jgi:site-specific DNA recombinase
VQQVLDGNRHGNQEQTHAFALRGFLYCAECGCKITAERQKGFTYYRCTHGKGREVCHERAYTREEKLLEEVEGILGRIEIGPAILENLVEESLALDAELGAGAKEEQAGVKRAITENKARTDRLLDAYLDGTVDKDAYYGKSRELGEERLGLERRLLAAKEAEEHGRTARLAALCETASYARVRFQTASTEGRRKVLSQVLLNGNLGGQKIVDFQLKEPFSWLEMDENGAFIHDKWALLDLNGPRPPA